MNRDRDYWWAPLTGVLFIALIPIGGLIAGEPPSVDDPVREIVDHYVDDKDAIMVGALLEGVAAALLIFFVGYLRKVLRAAEGEGHMLSALTLVGATLIAVGATIDGTISIALAESADEIDPAAVQALQALWENDWLPFSVGAAVFLLSSGLSIVRHGALPAWLGWIAVLLGVIALTPIGFVGFLGGGLWILVVSVMLTLRARSGSSGSAGTAGPAGAPGAAGTGV